MPTATQKRKVKKVKGGENSKAVPPQREEPQAGSCDRDDRIRPIKTAQKSQLGQGQSQRRRQLKNSEVVCGLDFHTAASAATLIFRT